MPFVLLYLVTKTVSWGPEQSKPSYANISKEKILLGNLSSKTIYIRQKTKKTNKKNAETGFSFTHILLILIYIF